MDSAGGAAPSNGAPSTEVKLYDDDVDDDDNDVDGGDGGGGQCKQSVVMEPPQPMWKNHNFFRHCFPSEESSTSLFYAEKAPPKYDDILLDLGLKSHNFFRLCHLTKWPHFQGYGFNLHTNKSEVLSTFQLTWSSQPPHHQTSD